MGKNRQRRGRACSRSEVRKGRTISFGAQKNAPEAEFLRGRVTIMIQRDREGGAKAPAQASGAIQIIETRNESIILVSKTEHARQANRLHFLTLVDDKSKAETSRPVDYSSCPPCSAASSHDIASACQTALTINSGSRSLLWPKAQVPRCNRHGIAREPVIVKQN